MFAEEYNKYSRAFASFNKELFNNELPEVFLTFQRSKKAYGYFHAKQFERRDDDGVKVHEIALNPSAMRGRSAVGIFATLVHEMCHLWQEEFGKHVPDGNYHNKEWAAKMEEIGLIPSDTGQEGGKKTGSAMSHYIDPNGKFAHHCLDLLNYHYVTPEWQAGGEESEPKAPAKKKMKFTCPSCEINAWGYEDLMVVCATCEEIMEKEGK